MALLLCLVFVVSVAPIALGATTSIGLPASITVQSIPPVLPADGKTYHSIVISLTDASGNPSLALTPIVISLTSSELNVGTINSTVTIPPGYDYVIASLTTSNIPGYTEITATSPSLLPGFDTVSTATPSGLASTLVVFPVPASVVAGSGGMLVIELQDATGLPAKSATGVAFQLSSSNPNVISLSQSSLTIPAGQFFVEDNYSSSNAPGSSAVISAFSPGYVAGQGVIYVVTQGTSAYKVQLKGIFQPGGSDNSILPADGQTYYALQVGVVDLSGDSVPAPAGGITVQISSSKNTIVGVPGTIVIPGGAFATTTSLKMGIQSGVSNITAFSQGYLGSSLLVTAVIPAPSRLALYVDPDTKILNGLTSPLMVVQLQDANGAPARAKQATSVLITSSNSSVAESSLTLNMSTGQDFVSTFLHTPGTGSTVLTASSPGLVSARGVSIKVISLPLSTSLVVSQPSVTLNGSEGVTLSVEFLGQPLAGANVTWYVTGGEVSQVTSVTLADGTSTVLFKPLAVGAANVTAVVSSPAIGQTELTSFVTVLANPTPKPVTITTLALRYWYLGLIVVALVVVYVGLLIRRRRTRARMELEAAFQTIS